jgi:hypothetical protein
MQELKDPHGLSAARVLFSFTEATLVEMIPRRTNEHHRSECLRVIG